mmetsp:Transcript_34207/g.62482  ORF Transcript_34207/g.62482 Transcript_34207/m.62482 type:complete len:87 (+) Transcript_34207:132-392(+)
MSRRSVRSPKQEARALAKAEAKAEAKAKAEEKQRLRLQEKLWYIRLAVVFPKAPSAENLGGYPILWSPASTSSSGAEKSHLPANAA